jgi:hypothetical protein
MKDIKKEVKEYIIYYFLLFYLLPFIILGTGIISKGLELFLLYMGIIFPVTYAFFLWYYKNKFKDKIENYKKLLLIIWGGFLLLLALVPLYFYYIVVSMFKNANFF